MFKVSCYFHVSYSSTGSHGHVSIEELCMGSGCGPLPLIVSSITSSTLMLDLAAHQDTLLLAGNLVIGMYTHADKQQTNKQTCLSDLAWDLAWILDLSTYQNTSLLSENLLVGYIYTLKQTNKQTYLSNLAWVLDLSSIIAYITVVWDVTRGSYRDIGQYLRIFFLAKHHLSCKNKLLIYKYKKKNSKISSKSEEIINFCYACIKWRWG